MAFISELSNTRRAIVCAVLTAAAAGPIVAVLNTAIMDEWWNTSLTGADALETVVKLPMIMAWIGLVGLPVEVAIGVPSGVILAWRANACGSVGRLDREAMVCVADRALRSRLGRHATDVIPGPVCRGRCDSWPDHAPARVPDARAN